MLRTVLAHYRTDPQEMLAIYEEIRENKWQILGIYHSHTQTSAYPSTTDIKCAVLSGPIYFILSMKNQDQPVIRGFRILEGIVTETELRIVKAELIYFFSSHMIITVFKV